MMAAALVIVVRRHNIAVWVTFSSSGLHSPQDVSDIVVDRKAKHELRNPTAPAEGQAPSTAASPRSAERSHQKVVFDLNGRSHQVWHDPEPDMTEVVLERARRALDAAPDAPQSEYPGVKGPRQALFYASAAGSPPTVSTSQKPNAWLQK